MLADRSTKAADVRLCFRASEHVCLDAISQTYSAAGKRQTFILSHTAGYSARFQPVSENRNSDRRIKFIQYQPGRRHFFLFL